MTIVPADEPSRRLHVRIEAVAGVWLVALPLLRPLVWSGQPTDVPNLFLLVLLAAAITTGLLLRGLEAPDQSQRIAWWRRPLWWGVAFLACAAFGSVASPRPAAAWTLTVGWALHLAVPWALWPAIRRRPHLVVAGLLAGVVGELALMIGQVLWERPRLVEQLASDPALTAEQRIADQYAARVHSWRLEGTFLLANTLATYLVLLAPVAVALAWRCRTAAAAWRWGSLALAAALLGGVAMTGSKAGILALVVAGVACLVLALRSQRARLGVVLTAVALLGVALAIPGVRAAALASAGVRVDYWRAAVALVAERPVDGHGLEGFAVHYPRVKPPAAEETILVHQETLQAAVDLGLPAAALLLLWWLVLLVGLRPAALTQPGATGQELGRAVWIGVPLVWVFAVAAAGVLQANLAVYPGGAVLWGVLLIIMMLLVAAGVARWPLPPVAACWCGVLAALVHVQADFSLHSMQVVGVVAWVAVLGRALRGPPASAVVTIATPARQMRHAIAGLAVLMAVTVGVIAGSLRGEVLDHAREAERILARLRLAVSARMPELQRDQVEEAFERAVSRLVVEDRAAALTADPREALAIGHIRRCLSESGRFPADHDLLFTAIALGEHLQAMLPNRIAVLTHWLEQAHAQWPGDLLVVKALSEHYLRLARAADDGAARHRDARQAQAMAQRAVELYPTHLPLRQTLIAAAELTGDHATVARERAETARLAPLVHPDNRLR